MAAVPHAGPVEVAVAKVGRLAGDEVVGHRPKTGLDFAEGGEVKEEAKVFMDHPRADAAQDAVEDAVRVEVPRLERFTGTTQHSQTLLYTRANFVAQLQKWQHTFS